MPRLQLALGPPVYVLGDNFFEKSLPIETVKPNRLKITLTPAVDVFTSENSKGGSYSASLSSRWLHGAPARKLKAKVEVSLSPAVTRFEKYPDYSFDDLTLAFREPRRSLFKGTLDEEGNTNFTFSLTTEGVTPGSLNACFHTRVFEEGGSFSMNQTSVPYYPYNNHVGLRTPPGDKSRGMLLTDEDHTVDIVTLNGAGEPVSQKDISVKLYKIKWRWWWNKTPENLSDYMNQQGSTLVTEGKVNTQNGLGTWTLRVIIQAGALPFGRREPQIGTQK